jgi:phosphohistidine phosphatase
VKLLLVRHGPAADRRAWGAQGKDDRKRPLTAEGTERTRMAAGGLAHLVDPPDVIASSPYVRALETARIVAAALGGSLAGTEPERVDALAHDAAPGDLAPWLGQRSGESLVVAVGHEPQLGRLASWLLTGEDRSILELRKAGACLLDLGDAPRPGSARLLWLLAPSQLRRLARRGR